MSVTEIVNNVSKQIKAKYELDDGFVKDIEGIVSSTLDKYNVSSGNQVGGATSSEKKKRVSKKDSVASKKGTASAAPKAPKKSSGYNMYVTEMMLKDEIKQLPHKERMGKIGSLWKGASDDEKKKYTDKAIEKNSAASSTTTA
jgi:hypothetical protein